MQRIRKATSASKLRRAMAATDVEQVRIKAGQPKLDTDAVYVAPHHERQQAARCQQHGVNNAAGAAVLSTEQIERFRKSQQRKAAQLRKFHEQKGLSSIPAAKSGANGGPGGMWSRNILFGAAAKQGLRVRRCRLGVDGKHPNFVPVLTEYLQKHPQIQLLAYVEYHIKKLDRQGQATLQGVSHCVALRDGHIIDSQVPSPVPWSQYFLLRYVTALYALDSRTVGDSLFDAAEGELEARTV